MPQITVTLHSFDKRKNSTAQPTAAGRTYVGEIKHDFSLTGFSVKFDLGVAVAAPTYNYAHIESLRRYYFITDWTYSAGFWVASLAVDVLASWKTEIGNSSQYVLRAYSRYSPGIIDTSYPTTGQVVRMNDQISAAQFWGADVSANAGLVVMGVIGASASGTGAVTYYALSMPVFRAFMQSMLSSIDWAGISTSEISKELQKALINPTQYIVSCRWYPILASSFTNGTPTTTINLGWWSFTVAGARILSTVSSAWVARENSFTIPKHPQRTGRGEYLNLSPYSTYMLRVLPFGVFELDSTDLFDMDTVGVQIDTNLMTGDSVMRVAAKTATIPQYNYANAFLVVEGQIGVPLPIGQVSADVGNYQNALMAGAVAGASDILGRF